jgi:guanine deaminase
MSDFMLLAKEEASRGVKAGHGGPFGAVIVANGKRVASAHNEVVRTKDPTAHAEILAIRRATRKLGRFDLSDCVLYTSCEPCPMCLFAIHWARIRTVYFGCDRHDAREIGFDDGFLYDLMRGEAGQNPVTLVQAGREACLEAFEEWRAKRDKVPY